MGRLPDVPGGSDPDYLVNLLTNAANFTSRSKSEYESYLAISAARWKPSTEQNLQAIFPGTTDIKESPPNGTGGWGTLLQRRTHFINCHGDAGSPVFRGQNGQSMDALSAKELGGTVTEGTVVVSECCWGAHLYAPPSTGTGSGQLGICSTYLKEGAYGFLGSLGVSHGGVEEPGYADLLCQLFLKHILDGASLGEALLKARQQFLDDKINLDRTGKETIQPHDLVTLAEFALMGDPSVRPVAAPPPAVCLPIPPGDALTTNKAENIALILRQERLRQAGSAIIRSAVVPKMVSRFRPANQQQITQVLTREATAANLKISKMISYEVHTPGAEIGSRKRKTIPEAFHLAICETGKEIPEFISIVATEIDGALQIRWVESR